MHDVDPKELAKLVKFEKQGKLMWQKGARFELVSNGQWTVVVDEIKEMPVRLALFSIFGEIINAHESIEMAYGEIKRDNENYMKKLGFEPEYAMQAAMLTNLTIGADVGNPEARFIYDTEVLTAVDPAHAAMSYSKIVYRGDDPRAPIYLGEHKEIMLTQVWAWNDQIWPAVIRKYTGVDVGQQRGLTLVRSAEKEVQEK